jgi:hypothetical protein
MAGDLNIALSEAAKRIVPVAKMSADRIEQLRREANGKYISAEKEGVYQMEMKLTETKRALLN